MWGASLKLPNLFVSWLIKSCSRPTFCDYIGFNNRGGFATGYATEYATEFATEYATEYATEQ